MAGVAEVGVDAGGAVLRAGDEGGEGIQAVALGEVEEEEVGGVVVAPDALIVAGPVGEGDLLPKAGRRDGALGGDEPGGHLRDALVHPGVLVGVHQVVEEVLQLVAGEAAEGAGPGPEHPRIQVEHGAAVAVGEDAGGVVVAGREVAGGAAEGSKEHGGGGARALCGGRGEVAEGGPGDGGVDAGFIARGQGGEQGRGGVDAVGGVPEGVWGDEAEGGGDLLDAEADEVDDPEGLGAANVGGGEGGGDGEAGVLPRAEAAGEVDEVGGGRGLDGGGKRGVGVEGGKRRGGPRQGRGGGGGRGSRGGRRRGGGDGDGGGRRRGGGRGRRVRLGLAGDCGGEEGGGQEGEGPSRPAASPPPR